MILNAANFRSLYTGFSTAFQTGFAGVKPSYGRISMTVPSTTRTNEYGWLNNMPRVREWIGERVVQNLSASGYAIRNRSFELTVGVDRDDLEDDNIGIYAPMFTELGRSAAAFPDELVWPLLSGGFATPCYDGQYFFDTDHPVLDKSGNVASVSNSGGGAGTPWFLIDDSRTVRPIIWQDRRAFDLVRMDQVTDEEVFSRKKYRYGIDGRCNAGYGFWQLGYGSRQVLNADNYAAARAAMANFTGDYGRPLGVEPRLMVVPPSLEGLGRQILNADRNADGSSNVWQNTAQLLVVPWLAQ